MNAPKQIQPGKSITLIQLIISIVVILTGAVGLYVKSAVTMSQLNDRIIVIEKTQAQYQANSETRVQARNSELRDINQRINQNTNDINIINTRLPFFQLKR